MEPMLDRTLSINHQAKKNETKVQRVEKTTRKLIPEIGCSSVGLIIYVLTSKTHISESCRIECPGFPDSRDQQNLVSRDRLQTFQAGYSKCLPMRPPYLDSCRSFVLLGLLRACWPVVLSLLFQASRAVPVSTCGW